VKDGTSRDNKWENVRVVCCCGCGYGCGSELPHCHVKPDQGQLMYGENIEGAEMGSFSPCNGGLDAGSDAVSQSIMVAMVAMGRYY